ncbi:hypothetical protein CPB85DRAFT_1258414 [Mucidula mucida]|nr:hypothetical protein CPB85DRAFT_1258414 [Mucidula mucida]
MHSPAFSTHTKVSKMEKQSAVKVDCHEVDQYQSSSRPRANSLPALTHALRATVAKPPSLGQFLVFQPSFHTPASFSDSFPRINLRSLFVGRRRSDKPRRNTAGLLDNMTPWENMPIPDVSTFNDVNRVYLNIEDGNIVPSQYPVTGPIREEEPLALDILISAGQFNEEEMSSWRKTISC